MYVNSNANEQICGTCFPSVNSQVALSGIDILTEVKNPGASLNKSPNVKLHNGATGLVLSVTPFSVLAKNSLYCGNTNPLAAFTFSHMIGISVLLSATMFTVKLILLE